MGEKLTELNLRYETATVITRERQMGSLEGNATRVFHKMVMLAQGTPTKNPKIMQVRGGPVIHLVGILQTLQGNSQDAHKVAYTPVTMLPKGNDTDPSAAQPTTASSSAAAEVDNVLIAGGGNNELLDDRQARSQQKLRRPSNESSRR